MRKISLLFILTAFFSVTTNAQLKKKPCKGCDTTKKVNWCPDSIHTYVNSQSECPPKGKVQCADGSWVSNIYDCQQKDKVQCADGSWVTNVNDCPMRKEKISYREDNSLINNFANKANALISENSYNIGNTNNFKVSVVNIYNETTNEKISAVRISGKALVDREYFIDKNEVTDLIKLFETPMSKDFQSLKYKCKSNIRFWLEKQDGNIFYTFNLPVTDCVDCYTWQVIEKSEIQNLTALLREAANAL